jgi:hypothetical protein
MKTLKLDFINARSYIIGQCARPMSSKMKTNFKKSGVTRLCQSLGTKKKRVH